MQKILILLIVVLFSLPNTVFSSSSFFMHSAGKRIATEENGAKYFLLQDHLASTNALVDEAGAEVLYTEYLPFGSVKSETGIKDFRKKFTGKELDASTGLYDYGARQYDPGIGRFITPDPLQWSDRALRRVDGEGLEDFLMNPQNLNRYSYGLNNPLTYVDIAGLKSLLVSRGLPIFSHNFVVTHADFLGDPKAKIHSYATNEQGKLAKVDSSSKGYGPKGLGKDAHRNDLEAWKSLSGKKESKDVSTIDASDDAVERFANSVAGNQDYAAFAGPFGVNSNSAAQAVARRSTGQNVRTPGGLRLAPGASSWRNVRFVSNTSNLSPSRTKATWVNNRLSFKRR